MKNEARVKDDVKATQDDGAPKKLKLKTSTRASDLGPPDPCTTFIT